MYEIIVNPASKSGKGMLIWQQVEERLKEKQVPYHVQFSKKVGDVTCLAAEIAKQSISTSLTDASSIEGAVPQKVHFQQKLIVLGGDGTMNEALNGIASVPDGLAHVQVGYLPSGSSNDFARDLPIPSDPLQLLEQILSCDQPHLSDIGCLIFQNTAEYSRLYTNSQSMHSTISSRHYFDVSAGIGFDAAVCEEALASTSKNLLNRLGLGKLTYLVIALKQLITAKRISCTLTIDDHVLKLPKFLFVAGMIHQYEGGGFKFCPGASDTDGLLDICVAGAISKPVILLALPTAFWGKHYFFHGIDKYTASSIRIQTSAPLWVHTDGEVHIKSSDITMTCEQQKLQLLL